MTDAEYLDLCNRAFPYYEINKQYRFYHNAAHAKTVMVNCGLFRGNTPHNPAVELAACWHDTVYYPGIDGNENASAIALLYAARDMGIEKDPMVSEAMDLIKHTKIADHMSAMRIKDPSLAILLDADLSTLAAGYITFCQKQDDILLENFVDPKDLISKRSASANFLGRLMCSRKFIYHTAEGRARCEETARDNITKYIKTYAPTFVIQHSNLINSKRSRGINNEQNQESIRIINTGR